MRVLRRVGRGLRRRGAVFLIASASLAALSAAVYEESFVHSDDGCEVETHCLACRLAVASATDTPPPVPTLAPPRDRGVRSARREPGRPLDRAVRQARTRGPPPA